MGADSLADLPSPPIPVGNTPLRAIALTVAGTEHVVYLKEERCNPFGSIKDRVAWVLLAEAMRNGRLARGGYVIDASSGNFGAALAGFGLLLDVRVTIVASENLSTVNRKLIVEHGAELHIAKPGDGESAFEARTRLVRDIAASSKALYINQYLNAGNPRAHRMWTAPEALSGDAKFDAVFLCASSGGTAQGFSQFMGECDTELVVVDSSASCVLEPPAERLPAPTIPGFGSTHHSEFGLSRRHSILRLPDAQAAAAFQVLETLGLASLGLSSCGILVGALGWLARQETSRRVLCICPDGAEKYRGDLVSPKTLGQKYPGYEAYVADLRAVLERARVLDDGRAGGKA